MYIVHNICICSVVVVCTSTHALTPTHNNNDIPHNTIAPTTPFPHDRCANLEQQVLQRVAGGGGPGASPEQQRIAALLQYYWHGQGGPLRALIQRLFDVDVDALSAQALSFRDDFLTVGVY